MNKSTFQLVGGHYRNGIYYPGCTIIFTDDGQRLAYPESWSLMRAVAHAEAHGDQVEVLRQNIAEWVQTGKCSFGDIAIH